MDKEYATNMIIGHLGDFNEFSPYLPAMAALFEKAKIRAIQTLEHRKQQIEQMKFDDFCNEMKSRAT